jgi:hypothetical protein
VQRRTVHKRRCTQLTHGMAALVICTHSLPPRPLPPHDLPVPSPFTLPTALGGHTLCATHPQPGFNAPFCFPVLKPLSSQVPDAYGTETVDSILAALANADQLPLPPVPAPQATSHGSGTRDTHVTGTGAGQDTPRSGDASRPLPALHQAPGSGRAGEGPATQAASAWGVVTAGVGVGLTVAVLAVCFALLLPRPCATIAGAPRPSRSAVLCTRTHPSICIRSAVHVHAPIRCSAACTPLFPPPPRCCVHSRALSPSPSPRRDPSPQVSCWACAGMVDGTLAPTPTRALVAPVPVAAVALEVPAAAPEAARGVEGRPTTEPTSQATVAPVVDLGLG